MHLAALFDDLENGRADGCTDRWAATAVCLAELAVGGGVEVEPVYAHPDLVGADFRGGIEFPGGLREDPGLAFGGGDAVQS